MAEHTLSTMNGLFREVYGDKLENLVCDEVSLADEMPFVRRDQQPGNYFNQPVRLTRSHGWTMNGTTGGAYALNAAEPCITKNAQIQGASFTIRETIGYPEVAKLLQSKGEAQKRAFVAATSYLVESMAESARFVREVELLYGTSSIGTIDAKISGGGTGTQVASITVGTFAPALWAGLENGYIDCYNGATKRNAANTIQVTAVSIDNRRVTLVGNSAELDACVAGDVFYLRGCKSNGMIGMYSIVANTGTLWGVPGGTYSMFQGNTHAAGSTNLVYSTLMKALNRPVNRGMRGKYVLYVSPKSWTDLNNDLAALRRYADKAGGSIEQGAENISYFTQSGQIVIRPHLYMMPSIAIGFPAGRVKRIGPTDLTFSLPGSSENFFTELPDNAGYQLKAYWEQAPFTPVVNHCLLISGITNSDD